MERKKKNTNNFLSITTKMYFKTTEMLQTPAPKPSYD